VVDVILLEVVVVVEMVTEVEEDHQERALNVENKDTCLKTVLVVEVVLKGMEMEEVVVEVLVLSVEKVVIFLGSVLIKEVGVVVEILEDHHEVLGVDQIVEGKDVVEEEEDLLWVKAGKV